MSNLQVSDDVIKRLRALVRDSSKGNEFKAAVNVIYQAGYKDAMEDASKKIREVIDVKQGTSPSDDNDGVGV